MAIYPASDGKVIRQATVYVDAHANYNNDERPAFRPVGETAYANSVAEAAAQAGLSTKYCAGIVSNIDLNSDDLDAILDAHAAAAPARLHGVRQIAIWNPAESALFETRPEYYAHTAFRRGFAKLAQRGLSFDACVYHFQIPQITSLARAFPDTKIILDHLGSPLGVGPYAGRRAEAETEWRPLIAELARCENVTVKLGGQNMWLAGFDWHANAQRVNSEILAAALRGRFHHVIDCFGPQRCMFESNFPLDGLSSSYATLWNSFKIIAASFSEAEKTAMFYMTANKIYRLGDP